MICHELLGTYFETNDFSSDFQSVVTLENLYDIKRPTAKKILKLIKSEPATDQER